MKLVTIGVPIYRRLNYLPHVLNIISLQDYPRIELIISDNGMNGTKIRDIVNAHYSGPYKFRQNPSSVSISAHFNQIVREASGEYFVLLADDDEISPNYVSELVRQLERYPQASVALAAQEILDEAGVVIRRSRGPLPDILSGADFVRAAWHTFEYRFECFATTLAKTELIRRCGGYPDFTRGSHNDNALLIKLCLNDYVVFSDKCAFRWRVYESSHGWSIDIRDLAAASREFLLFLDSDPAIQRFAVSYVPEWRELKHYLVTVTWETYFERWRSIYRERLPHLQWVKAAFALPFILAYYRKVISTLIKVSKRAVENRVRKLPRSDVAGY